eukprot:7240002-Alexandrium_andersonii.AAC.1
MECGPPLDVGQGLVWSRNGFSFSSLRSARSRPPEDIGVTDGAQLTLVSLPPVRIALQPRAGGDVVQEQA